MDQSAAEYIVVEGADENNLKHLSLRIPKKQITVFTGVSGSGKSSLVLDTIAAKSRRELNETFPSFVQQYLPKYGRPHVERIENLPVAIVIDQRKPAPNARSTVGTYTDIYALLRLLFSRVGKPFVGYSDTFSFNHPQGRCTRCDGLGEVTELDVHKLVDFDKSLNEEGVIHYVAFRPGEWRWIRYACSGLFDLDKKIRDYSPDELELFLYSPQIRLKNPPAEWPKTAKYEGLMTRMYRSIIHSEEGKLHRKLLDPMTTRGICPDCKGSRLNPAVLSCRIEGKNIAEVTALAVPEMIKWLEHITDPLAEDLKSALRGRLEALEEIGLGYLTLDRGMGTLSGGEAQRCKIAKYINSALSDILYVLDEPSVGLHSLDIHLLKNSVRKLRDHGNTVLLVEHHKEMIKIADHVVDMGPGSGMAGGSILYEGDYEGLLRSGTETGNRITEKLPLKSKVRNPREWFCIEHACLHNLKDVSVNLPMGILVVIAGVAGSGKSSLMECFRQNFSEQRPGKEILYISQKNIGVSLRSTPATYLGVADDIRKIFGQRSGVGMSMFAFNGKGGCPVCGGKGVVVSDMAFMEAIETVCEACGGLRYSTEALQYKVDGYTIAEVMDMTVRRAAKQFAGTNIEKKLQPLLEVGLGYLHLNQALSTLSGGELQRMKLASYLGCEGEVFVVDEPTDGLHVKDIHQMIALFESMVERGNSIFLVEHQLEVLKAADYVIELGPGGGQMGGQVLFAGTPAEMLSCPSSVTASFLAAELPGN
ncbi:daunorubicin resistance protein DrrC [Odoribacter laneus]|jgi:excinuclease ABC, subunit A, daunorubicin resistance protein|uniref:ATP-binding cassette domain-containing protein n=1 Tax=Odoribacter laneus TaxID=626933 RepID=UPI001897A69B|nr:ATP-binding cassette domain-containing protein [Odoribacter laneus]GKI22431.1 daunorubicin resistance protein DrrC [Odoribacter laneus]GKI24874.1 daunorubicin resistance protein DrrC [Odoribacter laneus]